MIIVTDILTEPIDEGAKVATFNLLTSLKSNTSCLILSLRPEHTFKLVDQYIRTNKLFLSRQLLKALRTCSNGSILYIPDASATPFSFIRAKILNLFARKDVYMIALQPRNYGYLTKLFMRYIAPKCIISQSTKTSHYLSGIGIKNKVLPLGVDTLKYVQFDPEKQSVLRKRYNIAPEKTVLLHVGHIQQSRNLTWLVQVKKKTPETEIIIVGSTYNNNDDKKTYSALLESGIRIIKDFTPNMEDLYNIADYYVFPVLRNDGAIETPLSVVEAMACNVPIITTNFGSLPDTFVADNDFCYVDSAEEIVKIINNKNSGTCNNRKKIKSFAWDNIAKNLLEIVH